MLKRKTPVIVLALLIAALLSPSATDRLRAGAQDAAEPGVVRSGDVEIAVRAGFNRLDVNSYTGGWVPFRITVTNLGEAISGRLIVRSESPANPNKQVREFVKDVQLPTGSRQLHHISAFLNSGSGPEVKLVTNDNEEIAKLTVNIDRHMWTSDQLEIAVVDTDPTTLNSINATEIVRSPVREPFKFGPFADPAQTQQASNQQANNQQGGNQPNPQQGRRGRGPASGPQNLSAHPTVVLPEDLPREFVAYDPVDVVVIGDAPLSQLTEDQARALRLWVASGGMLVVTGAADIAGLRAVGLDQLLPVEVQGASTASTLAPLTDVYGRFELNDPTLAMSARLSAGASPLIGTSEGVIVAEKNYGSGLVRFLALNPKINPYRGWAAAKYLWTDLLLPAAEAKPKQVNWITSGRRSNRTSSSWGMRNFLFSLAEIEPPSMKYYLFFLLFYLLVVGPVNYVILKWKRKLDLAWLTIPAVVVVFTVVSIAVAQVTRGSKSIAADVSLVELHQPEGLLRQTGALLIMPASKRTEEITFEGENTFVNDLADNFSVTASSSETLESRRDQQQFTLAVPLTTWTADLFKVRSISEGARPMVISESGAGSTVTVKNVGDAPITKAVYMSRAGVSEQFDIAPGQEQQLTLSSPQQNTFTIWYQTQFDPESHEAQIFSELASVLDRDIGGERVFRQGFFDTLPMNTAIPQLERPVLVGFVDKSAISMSFSESITRRGKAFCVVHL
jgi:hypothetical protein